MALTTYQSDVQRLLGTGSAGNLYSTADINAYINKARKQIAAEGQCIRAMPVFSGPITAITINSGGSNYGASTTVVISAPDSPSGAGSFPLGQQASASVTITSGVVTAVTLLSTGQGYFAPSVTFSGIGNGTGAVALAVVSGINQTVQGIETYPYSAVSSYVATSGSGISSIIAVNSIAIIWGNFQYNLSYLAFSAYEAYARTYGRSYQDVPSVFTLFGQGDQGSINIYPIPAAAYQMRWNCTCLPIALNTDSDPEAIPYPWTDAVSFLAAYYALTFAQRTSDADRMWKEYEKFMARARQASQPRGVTNYYGR